MNLTKFGCYSAAILGALSLSLSLDQVQATTTTAAATVAAPTDDHTYTTAEQRQIRELTALYKKMDQTEYNAQTIYASPTNLSGAPFRVGQIKHNYIDATTQWLNYYRRLVGLPSVQTTNDQNYLSQVGASVLAGVNANPMLSQHGLANATRPDYISTYVWQQAQFVTNASNLYFRANGESAGSTVDGLIADNNNIDGNDTGHRAWILSPYLQNFGIGAAYGTNSWKYVDMMVMNDNWLTASSAQPQKNIVTYPSAGVFPLEALTKPVYNHHLVPWSIYFSEKQQASGDLNVVIKDETTNQQQNANDLLDASIYQYGSYKSVYTFTPTLPLVSGHQYTVTLNGLQNYPNGYTYQFKLFNITDDTQLVDKTSALQQIDIQEAGIGTIKNAPGGKTQVLTAPINGQATGQKLANNTQWRTYGKTFINQQYFYNIGKNQWVNGRFLELSNVQKQGVLTIDKAYGQQIAAYNSPYYDQQVTGRLFATGSAWRYHQVVNIGGIDWYNLGADQWVPSTNVTVNE
ncbi:SLAP domain-containing protein [Agrilactobacillus yilanensis]|uniref:SLAP domain-containing protein n=1 Tax=Agrilactobacillus yilanensis TaxID=2485997 RepID=A0ABW4J968_9LACO|nr:SLAP domain-containing protein [Agrilactobacillus yilanensis]